MNIALEVSLERVSSLLCSALEGGSNYWYRVEKFVKPKAFTFRFDTAEVFRHLDYPLNAGGALLISDVHAAGEEKKRTERLSLASVRRGLKVMAQKHPKHFGDFLAQNDDASTGDVFLQCCLFGEVVYG